MDVRVFIRVIARSKWLFIAGVCLAVAAAFLSIAAVTIKDDRPVISWRAEEGWSSYSRLLVTAPSVKYGSIGGSPSATSGSDFQARAPWLATLYASFATSDRVKEIIRENGDGRSRLKDRIDATAISTASGAVLPIVQLTATSNTAAGSRLLVNTAAQALKSYVEQQQIVTKVSESARVQLVVLNRGGNTTLVSPRSKALPVIAFLSVLFATIAVVFAADNLMASGRRIGEGEESAEAQLRFGEPERVEDIPRLSHRAGTN